MKHKAANVIQDRTFLAALQGVDYGEATGTKTGTKTQPKGLFGNPKDYEHLSDEEKRELTEQMKKQIGSLGLPGLKKG